MRIPRSRGAASGLLLVILGLWGGFIPFVGQYFDYTFGPDTTWTYTTGRLWLDILPAAAVFLGGLMLMSSSNRASAHLGAWLALLGGIWFVVGPALSMIWNNGIPQTGLPRGSGTLRALEWIGWYYGLGAVVTALSAFALGRVGVVSVRDAEIAGRHHPVATAAAAGAGAEYEARRERRRGRFFRRGRADQPATTTREPVGTGTAGDRTTSTRD